MTGGSKSSKQGSIRQAYMNVFVLFEDTFTAEQIADTIRRSNFQEDAAIKALTREHEDNLTRARTKGPPVSSAIAGLKATAVFDESGTDTDVSEGKNQSKLANITVAPKNTSPTSPAESKKASKPTPKKSTTPKTKNAPARIFSLDDEDDDNNDFQQKKTFTPAAKASSSKSSSQASKVSRPASKSNSKSTKEPKWIFSHVEIPVFDKKAKKPINKDSTSQRRRRLNGSDPEAIVPDVDIDMLEFGNSNSETSSVKEVDPGIGSSKKRTKGSPQASTAPKRAKTTPARPKKAPPPKPVFFEIPGNYIHEGEHTLILGEDESYTDNVDPAIDNSLPYRILDDFIVYSIAHTNAAGGCRLTSLESCGEDGFELRASGKVRPVLKKDYNGGEEDEDGDDDKGDNGNEGDSATVTDMEQCMNVSTLFHWGLDMEEDGESTFWFRTQFAYYKLGMPAPEYEPLFVELFKKSRIANKLMVAILDNFNINLPSFLRALESDYNDRFEAGSSSDVVKAKDKSLGFDVPLHEGDFMTNLEYINEEIIAWVQELQEKDETIGIPPILNELRAAIQKQKSSGRSRQAAAVVGTGTGSIARKVGLSKREEEAQPCVTPLISSLAGSLFNRELAVAVHGDAIEADMHAQELNKPQIKAAGTVRVKWVDEPIGEEDDRTYYDSALVDKDMLSVGDCVYIRSSNVDPWLGKIMYFFQVKKEMLFHVRFFYKGSETLLMETAGWQEMFLLDKCRDIALDRVIGKCEIVHDASGSAGSNHFYKFWYDTTRCSFEDATNHESISPAQADLCREFERCPSCIRKVEAKQETTTDLAIEHESDIVPAFKIDNVEYHLHDFVYLVDCEYSGGALTPVASTEDKPYDIGQIIEILPLSGKFATNRNNSNNSNNNSNSKSKSKVKGKGKSKNNMDDESDMDGPSGEVSDGEDDNKKNTPMIKVRLFERYDSFLEKNSIMEGRANRIQKPIFKDCRRLVATNMTSVYSSEALEGTCRVELTTDSITSNTLSIYKDQDNAFYYRDFWTGANKSRSKKQLVSMVKNGKEVRPASMDPVKTCNICAERVINKELEMSEFLGKTEKLRALDIFSGCGGLSSGFRDSEIIETRYAIEFFTSAAQTYRHNFPNAVVYNDDANELLRRAIAQGNGETLPERKDFAGKSLSPMPQPGDVDMIYCGPPCQGFSGMNRYQHGNELKNSLIATSMSYVDFYKPDYFLLENVRGMMNYRLGGRRSAEGKHVGGMEMGVVKFILRCLTAMGYQCRIGLLQAGQFGVPQSRRRFFVWGAKMGRGLPDFPLPKTCFDKNSSMMISTPLPNHDAFSFQRRRFRQAPDPSVTCRDTLTDLPGFEYIDPHEIYDEPAEDRRERLAEERRAARDATTLKAMKARQRDRLNRKNVKFNESDIDGYGSSSDNDNDVEDLNEDLIDEADEKPRPYFIQVNTKLLAKDRILGVGYTEEMSAIVKAKYVTRPQSEYQRKMRARNPSNDRNTVHNHVSRTFNEENAERICRVPLRPEADHQDLPQLLKPWCLSNPDSAAKRHNNWKGLFGRLDFDGHFQTAVTDMQPMGKQGKVLHPNQLRVLSVRECARVQGFPDSFLFLSDTDNVANMYKQVGNAVPPPLARALAIQLREAMMQAEEKGKTNKGKGRAC